MCNRTDRIGTLERLASRRGLYAARQLEEGRVSAEPVRILVLYSHPLLGEGLGRMLADEPGLAVEAVSLDNPAALEAALADVPAAIIVEEGGPVDVAEIVRRSTCPVVIDVDITSADAWTLSRRTIRSRPEEVVEAVLAAIRERSREGAGSGRGRGGGASSRPRVRPATIRG
jgi:hypothetical protein